MSASQGLQALQHDAYTAVCRAFYAQESLRWEQEDVLTKLRDFWNISNQTHSNITSEMRSDPDVVAVRSGGMPSRLGHGKNTMVPAPSLGPAGHNAGGTAGVAPPQLIVPQARRRQTPPQLVASEQEQENGKSSGEVSLHSEGSEHSSRQQRVHAQRSKRKKQGGGWRRGGGTTAAPNTRAGSLAQQPLVRRAAPARPLGAPGGGLGGGGGMQRLASGGGGQQRSRSTRQGGFGGGAADPLGYVGRRLWRYWPLESPPWVEGFMQQWDPDTDGYVIVYDPNTRESTEEVFHFASATEGSDYVVGEYVDMAQVHGSRRQHDKPYVPPEVLQQGPPPGLLAALAPAPSKKRRSISGAPVPVDAPFETTYLHARLPIAAEDELQQMLAVLERKERIVEAEINILEYQEANREDIEKRGALEHRFQELCDREAALMAEMAALREAVAA